MVKSALSIDYRAVVNRWSTQLWNADFRETKEAKV